MILVGLPAYGCMVHIDVQNTLFALSHMIPMDVMSIGNESLIPRARNAIISRFVHDVQYSHLLFLDADVLIDPRDVLKLLAHNLDVIGAAVPLKGRDANGNRIYNAVNPIQVRDHLYAADKIGTAVMLLSRGVANALCKASEEYDDPAQPGIVQYNVFQTCVENRILQSEDYFMCKLARSLGYEVYIDDSIITEHNGMMKI